MCIILKGLIKCTILTRKPTGDKICQFVPMSEKKYTFYVRRKKSTSFSQRKIREIFLSLQHNKAKEAEPGKALKSLKIKNSRVLYNLLRLTGGRQILTSCIQHCLRSQNCFFHYLGGLTIFTLVFLYLRVVFPFISSSDTVGQCFKGIVSRDE